MSDDSQQGRLQEYGVDAGAAPVDGTPPTCERCDGELDGDEADGWRPRSREECMTNVVDLARGRETRYLCEDCRDLERYLASRYHELTQDPGVSGAVAVFCQCQGRDEVDVQAVRRGKTPGDRACSRCGSRTVVVEVLPPDGVVASSGGERL